jgi:hypothetical protein
MFKGMFNGKRGFETVRGMGVGIDTIKNFLGPNWSLRRIREALAALHTDELS